MISPSSSEEGIKHGFASAGERSVRASSSSSSPEAARWARRSYPAGEAVSTKITGAGAKWAIIKLLLAAATGRFNTASPEEAEQPQGSSCIAPDSISQAHH
jgi:hypothetical protein